MNTHSTKSNHPSVGRHPDRPAVHTARQTEEPSDRTGGGFSSILRCYPMILGITALTAVLLVTVAALALYNSSDPTALILPASAAVPTLAALCGGIVAGKLNPTAPMAAGLLSGGLTAALLLLLSLVFGEGGGWISWGMGLGTLLFSLLGSALTRPRKRAAAHSARSHKSGAHTTRK